MEIQKKSDLQNKLDMQKLDKKFYWYKNVEAEEHICKYKILKTINLKNKN